MKNKIFLIGGFLAIIVTILILSQVAQKNAKTDINSHIQDSICFKGSCFLVELAKSPEQRALGLMFRENLGDNRGMLFIFEQEKKYSFWMKNTLIALDIIWINNDKEVVFIKKDAQPCKSENCEKISPNENAKYVLELNAGITDAINLNIGSKLIFNISEGMEM